MFFRFYIAGNYDEFSQNAKNAKVSAFLAFEEGGVLDGKIENLQKFNRLGVRLITLAWNYPNQLGYPNKLQEYRSKHLTEFSIEIVREMNNLGMIVQVSYLSDQDFYDVAKLSTVPFVASHLNA
jgi:membrane dipeptidase